jgi:hypothetical protein
MKKICGCCNVEKSVRDFSKKSKAKDGLQSKCKTCTSKYYDSNKDEILKYSKEYYESNKDLKAIYAKKYREDSRDAITVWQKEYYAANRDTIDNYRRQYREVNKHRKTEYDEKYYLENKDRRAAQQKEYYEIHKDKASAKNAKRRAKKLQATPPWLTNSDYIEIEELFICARMFKLYTGEDYHVDHIVPLQGKDVCGLHVPWNLQVLPAKENLSKSNKI